MTKLHNELKKTKTFNSNFDKTQKYMKEGIMNAYNEKHSKKNSLGATTKKSFASLATVGVLSLGIVGSGVLSPNLTAQKVLAQAQDAITEQQNQGRYVKSVIKSTAVFDGQSEEFTITTWADTESENHRSIVKDANGNVIDTMVYKDGKLYASENPGFIIGAEGVESGEVVNLDDSSQEAQSVFFEADEEFEEFVKNNDVEIIDITDEDFEDIENIDFDVNSEVDVQAIGGSSEKIFKQLDDIQSENDPNSRLKLIQSLAEDEDAELNENVNWEGYIAHKLAFDDITMYFDTDSLTYLGSEQVIDEPEFQATFKDVLIEESYSDNPIDLSTDRLEEAEIFEATEITQ